MVRGLSFLHRQPVRAGGAIIGLEGFLIDITPLKRAESAMQRSQAELKAIYDSAPLMLCLVDREAGSSG